MYKDKTQSSLILKMYPDKIPVIVERLNTSEPTIKELKNKKYLVPPDMTIGQFLFTIIRPRIELRVEQALFCFVTERKQNIFNSTFHFTIPPASSLISIVYKIHKDEDGFLYLHYSGENTFGKNKKMFDCK